MANNLQIIPLGGGPGTVTNNMFLYVYGKEALIIDCGIGFPDDKVSDDIIIPDISYIKSHQFNLQAIILSHGHDDHIAALPHLLPELHYPPVYASRLTAGFAQDRLKNFNLKHKIIIFKESDQLKLGPFLITPIFVTHSVPDAFHFVIATPVGRIYHGSDFKFDLTPVDNRRPNLTKIVTASQPGVLCLLSDCLRSERSGYTPSESTIAAAIDRELQTCPGRLIFTTMSSQIHRIQQAIDVCLTHGRKIAFLGRSMITNTQTARSLGFLKFPQKALVRKNQLKHIPDSRLCLIIAGSQGQETSSLTRYAAKTHKLIKPKLQDKVIYSADIIPGNEQAVFNVIDQLTQLNINVVYQELVDDLHVSGHASASELQQLIDLVKPQYLYPIGGSFRHMRQYQRLAQQLGYRQDQVILPQKAQVVEFFQNGHYRLAETLDLHPVRVNQSGKIK